MDRPGSEAVGIGAEADVNISELFASALRWQIAQKCLRLPLLQCLLPPILVGPLLLDPGQLQISRLTPLQKMKYIQIKCKKQSFPAVAIFFLRACGPLKQNHCRKLHAASALRVLSILRLLQYLRIGLQVCKYVKFIYSVRVCPKNSPILILNFFWH